MINNNEFKILQIEDFIVRSLAYYDPMGLIEHAATPHDEYDSDAKPLTEEILALKEPIFDNIYNIISKKFENDYISKEDFEYKNKRMSEDIAWFIERLGQT